MIFDSNAPSPGKWKVLESEHLFRRPWLTVRRDKVQLPSGAIHPEYYVLEYPDWINVIAITTDGQFVMVEQYRHGLGEVATELCAGVIEANETPEEGARRELMEETGFGGGKWREFMTISMNPGSANNLTHCFLAEGVELQSVQHLDETEDVVVRLLTREQLLDLMKSGDLKQALMLAPLWKYFAITGL